MTDFASFDRYDCLPWRENAWSKYQDQAFILENLHGQCVGYIYAPGVHDEDHHDYEACYWTPTEAVKKRFPFEPESEEVMMDWVEKGLLDQGFRLVLRKNRGTNDDTR